MARSVMALVIVVVLAPIESAHAADVARTQPPRPIEAAIAAGTTYEQPFQLSKLLAVYASQQKQPKAEGCSRRRST